MQQQDPSNFLYRQRIALHTVTGFDDKFTLRVIQMTAPVRNDPVTAAGRMVFLLIADNGMYGQTGSKRQFIQKHQHRIVRLQVVDAVVLGIKQLGAAGNQLHRQPDQRRPQSADQLPAISEPL